MSNFHQQVQDAYNAAVAKSAPFVPSRAEIEAEIADQVVSRLLVMCPEVAQQFMRDSYSVGWDSVAVRLYKEATA